MYGRVRIASADESLKGLKTHSSVFNWPNREVFSGPKDEVVIRCARLPEGALQKQLGKSYVTS